MPTSEFLMRNLSLAHLSTYLQNRVSYILFVPFGAVVVVFFRLCLGIRLLGPFRSILIAVAFQVTGILPGLVFLALVIAAVLVMSYGIQGDCRYAHIPGMLEMAGVPYTGSTPLGHALALDKVVTKILMLDAGVPTPRYLVMNRPDPLAGRLRFPLIVKPRHESTSYGLHFVRDQQELEKAVLDVAAQYQQDALVEEYIGGREVNIGMLGNDPVELLPIIEIEFGERETRAMTRADKYHKSHDESRKICPAEIGRELAGRLSELALATFRACRCRDYA